MPADAAAAVLDAAALDALHAICDLAPPPVLDDLATARVRSVFADVDLLVTGWGRPPLDAAALTAAPRLRAVVHTAGSVRSHVTEACWERGIEASSAAAANAVPVVAFTLGMILLTGKQVRERAREFRARRTHGDSLRTPVRVGNCGRTVGIVSASLVGRRAIELLRPHDFEVLLYDPYITERRAHPDRLRPADRVARGEPLNTREASLRNDPRAWAASSVKKAVRACERVVRRARDGPSDPRWAWGLDRINRRYPAIRLM
ncbi:hypothetical protein [Streptomyces sp. NPDC047453]|uniref:hypothetical protein n=1 Tax=Streptomyces sp. NPDC047453 TaxID=3154812 RepID=UPI0033CD3587